MARLASMLIDDGSLEEAEKVARKAVARLAALHFDASHDAVIYSHEGFRKTRAWREMDESE